MRDEKVRAIVGKPSRAEVLSDELGARMEDWWYGNNQKVRIKGGRVIRIVDNVAKEQEILTKINEAKQRGDEAEANNLLRQINE